MTSRRFFSSSTFRTDNLWTIFGDATVSLCHQTDVRGVWCGESSHLLLLLALQNSPGSPASLVSAFISSWLDYCNSLFSRLPGSAIQHVCKSTYTRRIENKKKSQMRRYLAKKMTLKVAWTVRIRRPAVTVEQADCSRLLDPRPRNSCRRVDCVSSEHWARWHKLQSALDKLFTPALSALCIAYLLPERHTATAQRAHEWQHAITADFIEMQWTTWYSWLEWTLLIYYLG